LLFWVLGVVWVLWVKKLDKGLFFITLQKPLNDCIVYNIAALSPFYRKTLEK
jgi:hypothetical protein